MPLLLRKPSANDDTTPRGGSPATEAAVIANAGTERWAQERLYRDYVQLVGGCVRIDFSGGVAHVDYAPKRPWYPMLEGALLLEADHRVGPLWLGVGIEGAGAFGIGVTPDGSPIPWSGFRVGTAITASWAQ